MKIVYFSIWYYLSKFFNKAILSQNMPLLFQGLSISTPNQELGSKQKIFLKQAGKYLSRTRINAGSEKVLRIIKESPKPVNEKLKHVTKPLGNPKGGLHLQDTKIPKWRSFKTYISQLTRMYTPYKQQLKLNSKSKRIVPRVRGKQFSERRKIPNKKFFRIKSTKTKKYKIKPLMNRPVPSARLPELGLKQILNGLISRYVFTKKRLKKLKKRSRFHRKPKKTYKRDIINKSKLFKLSLQHQKQRRNDMENKLIEVVPVLQELGELKGIRNPKKLTKKMHRTILKKLSRSAINLQTEYRDLLKYNFQKRAIKREKLSFPEPSQTLAKSNRTKDVKLTKSCGYKRFNFKLGKGLKVYDYGFKHLKRGKVSKQHAINDSRTHSPREAEIISNRKAFRTMDTNLRTFTRETATNIFLNANRLSDKKISSKLELLEQLNRLETLRNMNSERFDYFEESVSPLGYEISEKLNRTFASIKRINQSRANAAQLISDGRDSPFDFLTYDDDQVNVVPLAEEKLQPLNHRRKKRSKRFFGPQIDAATQTENECEICSTMQKYKIEKISPLVMEMAMKRNFLNQRQYYMENLKNRKCKEPDVSITKPNQSDYYPKIISETYENLTSPLRFDNYTQEIFKAYKAVDVTKMLSRCYDTLFEAEQRMNGIFSNIFDP